LPAAAILFRNVSRAGGDAPVPRHSSHYDHNNQHHNQHDKHCAAHNDDDDDQLRHYDIIDHDQQHIIDHDNNHNRAALHRDMHMALVR
jgi:hypothetical protein